MSVIQVGDIEVEVIRSRRKTLSIEVKPNGKVIARAPHLYPTTGIKRFVASKEAWIRSKLKAKPANMQLNPITEEEIRSLSRQAHKVIPPRVEYYAQIMGVKYNRIAIRCQKSKWGSCSSKGNLNFNCLLMMAPERVLDYVIVHELCHLKEMNHSRKFWAEVEKIMPDYREQRQWLKTGGSVLIARMIEGKEN